jgi:DNA-binding LacI/PurR family transcriptional regulator
MTYILSPLKEHDISYQERERGFLTLAKDRGIKVTPTVTIPRSSYLPDQIDFAYEAFRKFLKTRKTDLVFSANDQFAIGAKKAIDELGLGDKIKVVGNGGLNPPQEWLAATAITQYAEICETGLQEMLNPEFKMPKVLKIQQKIILPD